MERLQMSRFLLHLSIYVWALLCFGIKSYKIEHRLIKINLTKLYTNLILR